MAPLNIIITGAGGMLGRDLVRTLNKEIEIVPLTRQDLDITEQVPVEEALDRFQPSVLINAAAYTGVDDCETNEADAFLVNADAVGALAMLCRERNIFFVHFSTDYVFDGLKANPYTEEDEPHPLNAYGRSKLAGEAALAKEKGRYLLIRTSWLYGSNGQNFVDKMLEKAAEIELGRLPELRVVNDQAGSPTYTVDLARCVEYLLKEGAEGTFHVCNSGRCSWYEFAREILARSGQGTIPVREISSKDLHRAAKRPAFSALSNGRLEQTYGFRMRPWQDALDEYLMRRGKQGHD